MMKLLLRFLPQEYKNYILLAQRMFRRLDTAEERYAAVNFLVHVQSSDGYISATEWTKFGSKLGIISKPKAKPATDDPIVAPTG